MNRNYECPSVEPAWAESRETHIAVATAIHAIADKRRKVNDIWAAPTSAEEDHVKMAVQEYLAHGDFPAKEDNRYAWGASNIIIKKSVWNADAAREFAKRIQGDVND